MYPTTELTPRKPLSPYGLTKVATEELAAVYMRCFGVPVIGLRYFTVYGERGKEDHAVIAMIARAFIKQDPFVVWGTGRQIRNWTYVGDIADGMVAAAESDVVDGTPINLGTMERVRVLDAMKMVIEMTATGIDALTVRPTFSTR